MGGCFCIPGEPSLSWGPGESPGGARARGLAEVVGPGKAQGSAGLGKLLFPETGRWPCFLAPSPPSLIQYLPFRFCEKGVEPGKLLLFLKGEALSSLCGEPERLLAAACRV